jgi:bifunctional non-homologous end joining protein LigD
MSDQLSLQLEPGLPHLPDDLRPMLPRPAAEPFDSSDHLFEPSWGGERVLAFIDVADRGPLRLLDGHGRDLAGLLPELADLPARIQARSAVIDGELVVVDSTGRADPAALGARLRGEPGPAVAYLVFDLLVLDGRPLLGEPLWRRRDALRRSVTPGETVVAVPSIMGEGRALQAAVRAQGIGWIMARVRTSPYLPGIRSRLWRLISAAPAGGSPSSNGTDLGASLSHGSLSQASLSQASLGLEAAAPTVGPTSPAAPVLAVFRRLPFDDEA